LKKRNRFRKEKRERKERKKREKERDLSFSENRSQIVSEKRNLFILFKRD